MPDDVGRTHTHTFSRVWQWYVDSNSAVEVGYDAATSTIDEGWHIVPWHYLQASITPADWQRHAHSSSAFSVDAMSFEIGDVIMTRDELVATSSWATIRSEFNSTPRLMAMVDHSNDWDLALTKLMQNNDCRFDTVSGNLTKQWATNKQDHTLPRVRWMLPPHYNSALHVEVERLSRECVWCSLNTGDIAVGVEGGFGHSWVNPEKRWYALSSYYAQKGGSLEMPKARTLHDLATLGEYGSTEFNLETLANSTYTHMPPAV